MEGNEKFNKNQLVSKILIFLKKINKGFKCQRKQNSKKKISRKNLGKKTL